MSQIIYGGYQDQPASALLNKRYGDMFPNSIITGFNVIPGSSGFKVTINAGSDSSSVAYIGGVRIEETAALTDVVTLGAPSAQPRIDIVALRYQFGTKGQTASYSVIAGTAGSSPAAPALPDNTYIALAQIRVNTSDVAVLLANITQIYGTSTDRSNFVSGAITAPKFLILNGGNASTLASAATVARTITFPDRTGTVITNADTGTVTNTMLATSSITITAGAGLSGGGVPALGATTTISLNLGNPNTWTAAQIFAASGIKLTGVSANTIFASSAAAADKTITFPDRTGTVITSADSGTITNLMLAASSITITAGAGLSGGGIPALGGSVTISNSGVLAIAGTANQVNATPSTGSVTLSLPQNIHTGAIPQFSGLGIGISPAYGSHQLGNRFRLQALATPAAPNVAVVGTAGTTTYSYYVVAKDSYGNVTQVSPVGQTTTGNASPSSTNYNTVSWSAVPGAVSYDLLKTNTSTSLAIGLAGTSYNDQGGATAVYTTPVRNTTADLIVDSSLSVNGARNWGVVSALPASGMNLSDECFLAGTTNRKHLYEYNSAGVAAWIDPLKYQ